VARDIDRIIDFIREDSRIPPIIKIVLENRLDYEPSKYELETARMIYETRGRDGK
jgi:hypothetical protein